MTTKCYEVVLREKDRTFNNGYIIAQIGNGKIISLEGVLTCDFLTSEIFEDCIVLKYYVLSDNGNQLEEEFESMIKLEQFELPINLKIGLKSSGVHIYAKGIIEDERIIRSYQERLEKFKATRVFMNTFR